MKLKVKIFLFPLFFLVFLLKVTFAFALEVNYPQIFGEIIVEGSSIEEYARYFFNLGLAVAGIIALGTVVFGGVHYLISFGAGKITNKGKDWIKTGVLGLIIVLSVYVTVYTINPQLINLQIQELIPVGLYGNGGITTPPGPETIVYEEIPIGTLTENLLTRTVYCYDFDTNGDPIFKIDNKGDIIWLPDESPASTLEDNDRVDCLWRVAEAAKTKAKKFKILSEKIVSLMNQCNSQGCVPAGTACSGEIKSSWACPCLEDKCYKPSLNFPGCGGAYWYESRQEYCDQGVVRDENIGCKSPTDNPGFDTCPYLTQELALEIGFPSLIGESGREVIEHGPILTENEGMAGLDEFRTQYPLCSQLGFYPQNYPYIECVESDLDLLARDIIPIEQFKNKRLIDQLRYLNALMKLRREEVKKDLEVLQGTDANECKDGAEYKLSDCYTVKPYIYFIKLVEETDKKVKIIEREKIFDDPLTGEEVDISRYCRGFSFSENEFYQTCRNICPGFSENDFYCYKNCPVCPNNDPSCLESQESCVKECFDTSECPSSDFDNFKECLVTGRNLCLGKCNLEENRCLQSCEDNSYNICSTNNQCKQKLIQECKEGCVEQNSICLESCNSNSKCFLEYSSTGGDFGGDVTVKKNQSSCYIDLRGLKVCSDKFNDYVGSESDFKACVKSALKCNFCSDQYSGYYECAAFGQVVPLEGVTSKWLYEGHPFRRQAPFCQDVYYKKCNASGVECESDQDCQAGEECIPVTKCGGTGGTNCQTDDDCAEDKKCLPIIKYYGVGDFAECWKCPSCSECPTCPFLDETQSEIEEACLTCGTECEEYFYNDDPLTFYCRKEYRREQALPARYWYCPLKDEIPVGQTVDEAEKWAEELLETISDLIARTDYMIEYNIKPIGKETGYCECESRLSECKVWWLLFKDFPTGLNFCLGKRDCRSNFYSSPEYDYKCYREDISGSLNYHYECQNEECIKVEGQGQESRCFIDQHCELGTNRFCPDGQTKPAVRPVCRWRQVYHLDEDGYCLPWPDSHTCWAEQLNSCEGNPCQKMINLLKETSKAERKRSECETERESELEGYYEKLKAAFDNFKEFIKEKDKEKRSETLKKLTYSRKKMSEASRNLTELGADTTRVWNCNVLLQEGAIDIGCYGRLIGKTLDPPEMLMDNWFSCRRIYQ